MFSKFNNVELAGIYFCRILFKSSLRLCTLFMLELVARTVVTTFVANAVISFNMSSLLNDDDDCNDEGPGNVCDDTNCNDVDTELFNQ